LYFDDYGLQLGPLYFRYYGMIIMGSVLLATYVTSRLLKRDGKPAELAWDALLWVVIMGLIGARLYHVFTPTVSQLEQGRNVLWYLQHPLDLINTTQGGLGLPGALLGGVLGLYLFSRRRKLNFPYLLDIGAPGVALAQVIGRWGNFVNQELYGTPTSLPWGIPIRPENRLSGYEIYTTFHPLFLYESLWSLGNFILLLWLWRNKRDQLQDGDLFIIYLIVYSIGRFLLEFLRIDYVPLFGINVNQYVMLIVAIIGAIFLFLRHRSGEPGSESQGGNTG
jgi:phosphatidylglycerol:prolipoprotein diacylglycerol transferase